MNEKKKKILIVEDEVSMHNSLKEFLAGEGFAIADAFDGEEAIAKAAEEVPDLILLDIILPKKDGYEVLDSLKGDPKTKGIPVILLTNLESPEDIQRAFDKGAMTYLVKSDYELEDVAGKIRETLSDRA